MRITPTGNLAIGTSVAAGERVRIKASNVSSSGLVQYLNITNEADCDIVFQVTGTSATDKRSYIGTSPGSTSLTLGTGTAERARITSNGQIITAYDDGKYTQRGIVLLGSAFDNPVQSIITLPASGSTNSVISIKVTCNQNAYATVAIIRNIYQEAKKNGMVIIDYFIKNHHAIFFASWQIYSTKYIF